MDSLSAQDSSFLEIEDEVSHMHIGSVGVYEGPSPTREELLLAVRSKLHLVPRYRQKIRYPPFHAGPPVWIDDTHFNLDYHVRRTALASPGGKEELKTLVGRVMSQQLDRAKPLWEMWIAEGLGGGRWVLVSKVHHCMVDGVSGTDLLTVLLDSEREPSRPPVPRWTPAPEPSSVEMVAQPLARRLTSPMRAIRGATDMVRTGRQTAELVVQTVQGAAAMGRLLAPTPRSSLNGPIGPHRRWDWADGRLTDIKRVREGLGGTVNDVVLAAISRGFRELLLSRGEDPARRKVRTLVPVSVRRPHEHGTYNNRVSAMFAELPIGIADPVDRLDSIRLQMEGLKRSHEAVAGDVLTSMGGFAPALLLALGMRLAFRMPQRSLTTVTTNVPGPQRPLYLVGRRMLEAIPYVPLAGQLRVGVAIFSYDGSLRYGVTGDYDTAPDIRVVCDGIEQGMAELIQAAEAEVRTAATHRKADEPAGTT
jgi:diacylglycerol O-acyltransferase / wax synthase